MALIPFDDRDGSIWLDGALVPWREAKVHVLSHGLHYASAVFEGERAYGGTIFRLDAHTKRLIESGALLDFKLPFTAEQIMAACNQVVAANGEPDAYVRPIAWRGPEQLSVSAEATKIHLAIASWPWPNLFGDDRMKGVRLDVADWKRPHPETAPTAAKAAGLYMIGTMAKHKAAQRGFEDAILMDWKGDVAEGTGENVFFVMDGELHTPTPICFLNGITRRTVISLAKHQQIKVVERTIARAEMAKATEVFVTGTAAEITPVGAIGDLTFTPGRITETVMRDYDELIHQSPAQVNQRAPI